MIVRNVSAEHIGLMTLDNNVNHTRWPCISHAPEIPCAEAVRAASKTGFRTLTPQQPKAPVRRFIPPEQT